MPVQVVLGRNQGIKTEVVRLFAPLTVVMGRAVPGRVAMRLKMPSQTHVERCTICE